MLRKQKAVSRGLRHDADVNQRIEAATKEGGFSSASAFMRAAIERELAGRESGVDVAEQRIAASLDRMAREIRNLRLVRPASVVRFRRYAGEDALDLCARTTEGCARPSRRPR